MDPTTVPEMLPNVSGGSAGPPGTTILACAGGVASTPVMPTARTTAANLSTDVVIIPLPRFAAKFAFPSRQGQALLFGQTSLSSMTCQRDHGLCERLAPDWVQCGRCPGR